MCRESILLLRPDHFGAVARDPKAQIIEDAKTSSDRSVCVVREPAHGCEGNKKGNKKQKEWCQQSTLDLTTLCGPSAQRADLDENASEPPSTSDLL
jgi:hypothetical protein